MHYNNIGLNVPYNASLAVYKAALVGHWLVTNFKTDNSPIDMWLSKMEASTENIVSLTAVGSLTINQLMEHEAAAVVIAKSMSV
jgi:hypothetical protein